MSVTLGKLVRHAELYGTDEVFEVARSEHLPADDLGALARRLRNVDPKWRLSREQARVLAVELHRAGMPPRKIAETCRIHRTTVATWLSRAANLSENGSSGPRDCTPPKTDIQAGRAAVP